MWPGSELVGKKGSEQVAAAYAVYGPRTVLVIALASQGEGMSEAPCDSLRKCCFGRAAFCCSVRVSDQFAAHCRLALLECFYT